MFQVNLCLALFLLLRLFNALLLQTFAEPDEFWQSQEVAHKIAFGNGWLTWEWILGVRDVLYPNFFAGIWILAKHAGISNSSVLVAVPKYAQAVITATGEFYFVKFAERVGGNSLAFAATITVAGSWYQWMYAARTLTNSVETALMSVFCYYWPWAFLPNLPQWRNHMYLQALCYALGTVCTIIRPTAALPIVLLVGENFLKAKQPLAVKGKSLVLGGFLAAVGLAASLSLDYQFYGRFVVPPLKFVEVNAISNISSFYGTNPWFWYLAAGVPAILGGFLVFFLAGLRCSLSKPFSWVVGCVIAAYSLLEHKEMRFLAGTVPFIHLIAAIGIEHLLAKRALFRKVLYTTVAVHLAIGIYATMVHQRGAIDVVDYLRLQMEAGTNVSSIAFLMPCHSTPLFARLHYDVPVKFLTCEPPLSLPASERLAYRDEARQFYGDMHKFIGENFPPIMPRKSLKRSNSAPSQNAGFDWFWPSHLVVFESLLQTEFSKYLDGTGYVECGRFFNSHYHPEFERSGDILVFCK